MQRKDIDDDHVIELARRWRDGAPWCCLGEVPGVVAALVEEGVPEKLAVSKVLQLCDKGLLEYGTSPYHAWPAEDLCSDLNEWHNRGS
jgi:hypothetical protein